MRDRTPMKTAKTWTITALIVASLGCSYDVYDPQPDDAMLWNPASKADGVVRRNLNVSAEDEETLRFRAPRTITLTMTQSESIWDDRPMLSVELRVEGAVFVSQPAAEPTLTVTAGQADDGQAALVEYGLTVRNHSDETVWGELLINGKPQLGPCKDIQVHWPTDSVQFVTQCTELVDGAVEEHEAAFRVNEANVCLAKGVWGMNNKPYWNVQGHIEARSVDFDYSHSAGFFETVFEDTDDESRVEVTDYTVGLVVHNKGAGVSGDHDRKTQVTFDRKKKTLEFIQDAKEWGAFTEWETQFATRWKCKAL